MSGSYCCFAGSSSASGFFCGIMLLIPHRNYPFLPSYIISIPKLIPKPGDSASLHEIASTCRPRRIWSQPAAFYGIDYDIQSHQLSNSKFYRGSSSNTIATQIPEDIDQCVHSLKIAV
ncbi:hypothetical protein CS542_00870 [Pedobacter sp. IW39]|nr:hypothetical protein CS542_00870 [Pedobacter sp. IW39]